MRREQPTGHPDQVRWDTRYAQERRARDSAAPRPHRLARQALALGLLALGLLARVSRAGLSSAAAGRR